MVLLGVVGICGGTIVDARVPASESDNVGEGAGVVVLLLLDDDGVVVVLLLLDDDDDDGCVVVLLLVGVGVDDVGPRPGVC